MSAFKGEGGMDYKLGVFAATILAAVGAASGAWAADAVVTKAPPAGMSATPSAPAPKTCTGVWDFIETDCRLIWNGVRLYGTVDVGGGYETNASRFAPDTAAGADYFPGKSSR